MGEKVNLLFDFVTLQTKTGAAEYVRTIFSSLLNEIKTHHYDNINIFTLYNSSLGIAYEDFKEKNLSAQYTNIKYIDIYKQDILSVITEYQINRFFIGCAQYLGNIPNIENISCETFCVVHDMVDEEIYDNNLNVFTELLNPSFQLTEKKHSILGFFKYHAKTSSFISFFRKTRKKNWNRKSRTNFLQKQHKKNSHFHLISVSDYSKQSISFKCKIEANSIDVLYSPERIYQQSPSISEKIKQLIKEKKIYLLLNANRSLKNPYNTINAFKTFAEVHQDCFLVTVGYSKKEFENHIGLPFLNDSDLVYLTKYCYALIYPSFFEGFGYPPIEAMKYGKPILASNTTSLPEILGNAPIYFSPLYATGIYKALLELNDTNYESFSKKSCEQYATIKKKTEQDQKTLLNYILNGKK